MYNNIPCKKSFNQPDPTREAVFIIQHIVSESKQNCFNEIEKYIHDLQSSITKLESEPEPAYKTQSFKLIKENIRLKQELIEKHEKALDDEKIFKELKDVKGINDWVLQK